ncbi:MAG TPA: aldo/keto reductase [Candidatus Synoicihabitans sp.]|nr:aldo/keto reductase [Candidatus Synoicihabitans sp.]
MSSAPPLPQLPRVVFGTSCLGNLYAEVPAATKAAICRNWFDAVPPPVALDSAGKYGAGLALEVMGRELRALGVRPSEVVISNKLGWYRVPLRGPEPTFERGVWYGLEHDAEQRISERGILECWEQGCELLGGYVPQLVSVHDPDEYLAAAASPAERARRMDDIRGAYRSLFSLKARGQTSAIGIGSKDWTIIRELAAEIPFDWVMLACSLTVYHHPPELLEFLRELAGRGVMIINSAVFHAGFLTGGRYFDYRVPSPQNPVDAPLFAWRERFLALCRAHEVPSAVACVQFSFAAPGVRAVALNTAQPQRVAENASLVTATVPAAFWRALREAKLIREDYPIAM